VPYASPDRKRWPESRPPFVRAQEAIIPRDMGIPSPTVLALSDRLDADFRAIANFALTAF
jgi:hypothetical protein